ncbi:unnamed protein product [Sphagnum troendelagicum]
MVKLRKECLKMKEFAFAYDYAPHAIHNLCMDLIKNFARVKHILKQIVFMVKTLKLLHLLLQLFDKLCLEKFKKTYVFILFTKTRWGTVFFTAQRASIVKATCAALPGKILNAKLNIDICDELKALVIDPAYWKGVIAMETLFMMINSRLTYLEGDEATFSAVYACFVAIKDHIKTLNCAVMDAFNLGDDDIEQMMTLFHHRFSTIYSEAHGLAFVTNPMFTDMCSKIAAKFGKDFLQVGKGSINQHAKAALVRLSNGNEDLRRSYFSEFAMFIMWPIDSDYDFNDIKFKPSELWTLCDDWCYGSIKGPLSALHKNLAKASGGKCNHKAGKCVHSRSCARLGQAKIKTGTAILFNTKQLDRQIAATRDTKFCKWLQQLGVDNGDAAEEEPLDKEEDAAGGCIEEFDRLDISGDIDGIANEDLFDKEVVDEGNIFN